MRYDVSVHGGFIHRKYGDRYDHKLIISWHLEKERERDARFRQPTINISIFRSLTPVSISNSSTSNTHKKKEKNLIWLSEIRIFTTHFDDFQMCLWHFLFYHTLLTSNFDYFIRQNCMYKLISNCNWLCC